MQGSKHPRHTLKRQAGPRSRGGDDSVDLRGGLQGHQPDTLHTDLEEGHRLHRQVPEAVRLAAFTVSCRHLGWGSDFDRKTSQITNSKAGGPRCLVAVRVLFHRRPLPISRLIPRSSWTP
jgi:hypothetical protein